MRIIPSSVLTAALLAVTACGSASTDDAEQGDTTSADSTSSPETSSETSSETPSETPSETSSDAPVVDMERSRFSIERLEVEPGTTVTFTNSDPFAHTITSVGDAPVAFDSGDLRGDATFEFTFDSPGTYAYFCEIHPTMRAEVIVR